MMKLGVKTGLNEIPECKHCFLFLWHYVREGDRWKKKVVQLPICTHSLTLSIWPSLFLFWASPGGTDKIKNKHIYININTLECKWQCEGRTLILYIFLLYLGI